jgi:hypothetical protein
MAVPTKKNERSQNFGETGDTSDLWNSIISAYNYSTPYATSADDPYLAIRKFALGQKTSENKAEANPKMEDKHVPVMLTMIKMLEGKISELETLKQRKLESLVST